MLSRHTPQLIALDGNLSNEVIERVAGYAREHTIDTLFEPTSATKALRMLGSKDMGEWTSPQFTYVTPNIHELRAVVHSPRFGLVRETQEYWESLNALQLFQTFRDHLSRHLPSPITESGAAQMGVMLLPLSRHVLVKCGAEGVVSVSRVSKKEWIDWEEAEKRSSAGRVVHLPI